MLQTSLIGHLGADAKLVSENGREFTTFRVAQTDRWTDGNGEKHESTTWVDCIMQGKPSVFDYLKKGQMVCVVGGQSVRVYSSKKDRCMKAGITISVRLVELLGGKTDEVPNVLYNPADNSAHNVVKYFYVSDYDEPQKRQNNLELVSRSGERFEVNPSGWVQKVKEEE